VKCTPKPKTNESSSLPPLPTEVLANIVGNLQDDKHSLAQCMRVSNTLNTLVAPLLYRTVTIRAGKTIPYHEPRGSSIPARLSLSPEDNIQALRHVIVHSHPDMEGLINETLAIDSLRVPISLLGESCECACLKKLGKKRDKQSQCKLLGLYRSKELVITGLGPGEIIIDVSRFDAIETIVHMISSTQPPIIPPPVKVVPTGIKRIISIFWTRTPSDTCGVIHPPSRSGRHARGTQRIEMYMASYAFGIMRLLLHHTQLEEIIIVNGGQLHHLALNCQNELPRSTKEVIVQAMVITPLRINPQFSLRSRPGLTRVKLDGHVVRIKFIPLRDYLEKYDWSGEFTPDEVESWLQDVSEED